jgi:hypothetical protein
VYFGNCIGADLKIHEASSSKERNKKAEGRKRINKEKKLKGMKDKKPNMNKKKYE